MGHSPSFGAYMKPWTTRYYWRNGSFPTRTARRTKTMKIIDFKSELRNNLEKIARKNNGVSKITSIVEWLLKIGASSCYRSGIRQRKTMQRTLLSGETTRTLMWCLKSKETGEIYILQCKHPKIAATDPIPEGEVKSFISTYQLLKDREYLDKRKTYNPKIQELAVEFDYWNRQNFLVHFIFITTGKSSDKTDALVEKFNRDNQNQNVKFDVWDVTNIKDEYVAVKSVEEQYPSEVTVTLADEHYLPPDGPHENITFAIRGTNIQELALAYKDSLFNWNIRRFLGKKGEVNVGLSETINSEPENFFYFNNGIPALCEEFVLNAKTRDSENQKTSGCQRSADNRSYSQCENREVTKCLGFSEAHGNKVRE